MITQTVTEHVVVTWGYTPLMLRSHNCNRTWLRVLLFHTCCAHLDCDPTSYNYIRIIHFMRLQVHIGFVRTYSHKGLACRDLCKLIRLIGTTVITRFLCKHCKIKRWNQFSHWGNILYIFNKIQSPSSEKTNIRNLHDLGLNKSLLLKMITNETWLKWLLYTKDLWIPTMLPIYLFLRVFLGHKQTSTRHVNLSYLRDMPYLQKATYHDRILDDEL